jgi:hypothetical protein
MFYFALQSQRPEGGSTMQGTHDIDDHATADDGGPFDPNEAARLLADAERGAQREFTLSPPLITGVMGVVILGGYVVLWLSTRGQHPYSGPSLGAVGLIYAAVAVSIGLSATVYQRATKGVSGPSVRQRKLEGVAIGLSYLGSPVIQGAMKHYGASHTIVYGVIPAAGPLIIIGTTIVGIAVSKEDWPQFGSAVAIVIAGIVALFVGPSGAWLAAGAGLFVGVVGFAVATGRRSAFVTVR